MHGLRFMLRLNALTCIASGVLLALLPIQVAAFLGSPPPLLLQLIGTGLVLHSGHLALVSLRRSISAWEVYYFSAGDIAWFLASLTMLAFLPVVSTPAGVGLVLTIAIAVMSIGLGQLWTYVEDTGAGAILRGESGPTGEQGLMPAHLTRLGAIAHSWLGMKTWVKIWLFALNAVFVFALSFWPDDIVLIVLAAYAATLPLLLSIMIMQRGLTRFLGIAHLIPWVPLLAYLLARLTGDVAGPQITSGTDPNLFLYILILSAFIALCLAFDAYDLARWVRGDTARLGSGSRQRAEMAKRAAT